MIFVGAGVLLHVGISIDISVVRLDSEAPQAVKDVSVAQEALIDIFERVENFFKRMESYIEVRPSAAMMDIIVKIMVEVLDIFAIATKEIKHGRASELSIPLHHIHSLHF